MGSQAQASSAHTFLTDAAGIIEGYLSAEAIAEPTPPTTVERAIRSLCLEIPEIGVGDEEAISRLRKVVAATPTASGPRFVNQLFAGRERVATTAELITAALNTSMYTYKAAGPMVLVEQAVIHRMLDKAGMTGGDGMFTPGGSLSNLAAMIIARNEQDGSARDGGFDGRGVCVYVSSESHYSVRKDAGMIGLGRDAVRPVPVDAAGRMRPDALSECIHHDRAAGRRPLMIVATSGTTVLGAFDPLPPLADIAKSEQMWLHVDGAFGGTALLHPKTRSLLAGIERADSFTWDAHKAMGVPLTCSVVLTPHAGLMQKHFDEHASYLFQQDFDAEQAWLNPGVKSLQCGRRNDALKLWAQWHALGDDGYTSRIEQQLELAQHAASIAREDDRFILSSEPEWLNVCFEVTGKPSEAVCQKLEESGVLKVGYGVVRGRRVIRLVTSNPALTTGDIERMMNDIAEAASHLPAAKTAATPSSS